jgi:DNA-binding CsgD family transcriptional regulator
MLILVIVLVTYHYKKKRMKEQLYESMAVAAELSDKIEDLKNQVRVQFRERHDLSNRLYSMYYDSENQDKITKQQLNVTINSLIKDYTATENVKKLDKLLNESYDGIMDRLVDPQLGLTEKELELFRYSFAGLSSKSVSVIIKESPQNIYQIKSRLLKKVRHNSEELWSKLNVIW